MSIPLGDRRVQRHAPIREQVAAILRDAIVNMELRPGQVLVERELCEMTSASRPSVREALRQLESEGLVESRNGRGTVVAAPTREQAEHLYEVRAELEGMAAELFAERADEQQRAELRAAFGSVEESALRDGRAMLAAKDRLYRVLIAGAGNPILSEMLGGLQRRVTQLRALTLTSPGRPTESLLEIRAIMAAIEDRDPAAARAAAIVHVEQAARTALTFADAASPLLPH
ncbi:MAG: GntR family transcriptional regulator [Actinomycetales bacterium]|nr:GntR family transcriptional regulator [Actinomycetales bacterium]